ncbi:hypothetical protein RJ53_03555 [Methanocalculus chunghsingensis]|uniref:Uncharacterized protein n=1 Tax=Methanocalculus chunghsingensis TaxID=156457 RepID=A0A8J7W5D4_9EURY|nr:hypothetical protein [Methanocalculus chunghsingensis]MBR1368629.1 hypothetical protein [Methanocalculus chunghsingensis]
MAQQKKKKKAEPINWTKIGAISIAILFAAMMALSLLGTGWIGGLRAIQPGDGVVIDYTIYNGEGIPVLTTSDLVMADAEGDGVFVYLSGPIQVTAGYAPADDTIAIPHQYGGISPFALFRTEFKAITDSVIGHRERDRVTVPFTFEDPDAPLTREMTLEQFEGIGGDFETVQIGDLVPLGFADSPTIALDDIEPDVMTRFAYVTAMTDETITLRYGYSHAVVTIQSVRAAS